MNRPLGSMLGVLADCAAYIAAASLVSHWLWSLWIGVWPFPAALTQAGLVALFSLPAWLVRRAYLSAVMARSGGILLGHLGMDTGVSSHPRLPEETRFMPVTPPPSGRPGRPGRDLLLYLRQGDRVQAERLLRQRLPAAWPITQTLVAAADEVALLMTGVAQSRDAGLASGMDDLFEQQGEKAARAIAQAADRVAVVASQRLDPERVEEDLVRLEYAVAELCGAVTLLRASLTRLMLDESDDLTDAQLELRAFGAGLEDVMDGQRRNGP